MFQKKFVFILTLFIISCSQKSHTEKEPLNTNQPISASTLDAVVKKEQDKDNFYEVKKGDTLFSLGKSLKVDHKKIAAWNTIKAPFTIEVGQILRINNLFSVDDYRQTVKNQPPIKSLDVHKKEEHKQPKHLLQRSQMVADILKANPKLEIARAVWQASSAKIKQQGALKDPMLSYNMAPLTVGNNETDYVQQVQLSQHLPWPGKLALQSDAASLKAKSDDEKVNLVRLELITLAKKLYGNWLFVHQEHLIHHDNVQLLKHVNKIAKIRYRVGKASQQEVLQSELELRLIDQHELMLTQNKIGVLAHINTLLSRPVETPLPLAQALPQPTAIKSLKFLQQKGLEDHPKIKALSAEIRSLEHKKENASLAVLPDFTVKAGYSTLMDNTDKHFTVGVAFNLPLNLSKYQAIEDEATAHLKQARWKKQDQVQELAELIQLYYSQVNKYQQTLKLYQQKILPLAKQNKLAALADYQAGYGGFLILIRAEKDWHRSRLKAMQTLIDYHENLALLEYAVGVFKLSKERGL